MPEATPGDHAIVGGAVEAAGRAVVPVGGGGGVFMTPP